ncbi:hypothetical protein K488DRAFT_83728 [Vararia minispora EC-137]|uniref:Uncharacterized protein n=1 Tax=Vararia minispora EC-137 TaxID=1314806 RepID=A0ACB8QSL6_9AGAM|nr:hypothetical protein K488DRAFT_83728 [Vararia minispora EC-137]
MTGVASSVAPRTVQEPMPRPFTATRLGCLARSPDDAVLLTVSENVIRVRDTKARRIEPNALYYYQLARELEITDGLGLRHPGRHRRSRQLDRGQAHMYDLETKEVVRKFGGHRWARHVVRGCFNEHFVASGSEDGLVYVWERVGAFEGRGNGTVNVVAWNPADVRFFATASDDRTARIWMATA